MRTVILTFVSITILNLYFAALTSGARKSRVSISVPSPSRINCTDDDKIVLDTALGQMIGHRKFPETTRDYRLFCNEVFSIINYFRVYNKKCLTEVAQQTSNVLLYTVDKQSKLLCKAGRIPKKARELMKASPCGNAARPQLIRCVDKMTASLVGIAQKSADKLKIPLSCCNFHKLKECIIHEAEGVKVCTKSMIDYVENYVTEAIQGILDLVCFEYQEQSDACDKIITKTPPLEKSKAKKLPKSPFLPAIDIIASIKEPLN